MARGTELSTRDELYHGAVRNFGRALDRLAAGYEADPDKRQDLRQEIHLQLWRSLEVFDGRCSLETWVFRVAHNTAASWIERERRTRTRFVSLEEIEQRATADRSPPDLDRRRALDQLMKLILQLKPIDRQIMISYLEGLSMASIADITGVAPTNVAMKIHRIRNFLMRRFS